MKKGVKYTNKDGKVCYLNKKGVKKLLTHLANRQKVIRTMQIIEEAKEDY